MFYAINILKLVLVFLDEQGLVSYKLILFPDSIILKQKILNL